MPRARIAVATGNHHKLREIKEILTPYGVEVVGMDAWPHLGELPEPGATFEENALSKARAFHHATGTPAVADDSGLEVEALGWEPGIHSKRFTPEATAEANNRKLLDVMAGEPVRRARFRCVIALVTATGEETAEGSCEGRIGHTPSGIGGFGYDPLFLPEEEPGRTMAELAPEDKNRISHRGRAFRQLPDLMTRAGLLS